MILPLRVLGSDLTKSIFEGTNDEPRRVRTLVISKSGDEVAPLLATTNATIDCPLNSSGTPTTAASAIASECNRAFSTSAGPTRRPATLIVSSERPRMNHQPSASRCARSPCSHTPGYVDQ